MPATPRQQLYRRRVERLIGLAAPVLDLVLAVGDRASRVLVPGEDDYYPIRSGAESASLRSGRSPGEGPEDAVEDSGAEGRSGA